MYTKSTERYDKTTIIVIKDNDKEYLVPYELINNIDIDNKKIYIKDIEGLFK